MAEIMRALNTKGDQQLAVSTTAVTLTVPSGAKRAIIQVTGAAIYFSEDGATPSSTNGLQAGVGDVLEYLDANYESILKVIKFICQSANATLNISYYD